MESTLQLFIRYKTQKTTCWTYSKCHRSVIFYIISWMFTYTSVFAWILFLYINISILFVYIVHNHQFHTLIFFCLFISRPLCSTSEVLFSPTHHTHYLFWQHSSVHRSFLFFFYFPVRFIGSWTSRCQSIYHVRRAECVRLCGPWLSRSQECSTHA